jgi:hypothetical protein
MRVQREVEVGISGRRTIHQGQRLWPREQAMMSEPTTLREVENGTYSAITSS